MTDYTAKIRAKGLAATGVTEDHIREMYAAKGSRRWIVASVKVDETHEKADGDRKVDLIIDELEVAPEIAEEHVRELIRSFYYERQVASDEQQLRLDDDIEPKVADVLEHGAQHRPHPYLASPLSTDDDAVCDVCGRLEDAPVHEVLADDQDDDEEPEDTPADDHQEPDDTAVGLTAVPDPFTH